MTASKHTVFLCDGIEIREQEYCVVRDGEVLSVEPRAFQVLVYLLRNPRRLIKKEELLQAVWGDVAVTENSLARAILKLRQIMDDDARSPRYIETVTRIGYRFVGSVAIQIDRASSKMEDHALAVVEEGGNGTFSLSPEAAPASRPADPPSLLHRPTSRDAHLVRTPRRTAWRWVLAIGAASILVLSGVFWYLGRPLPPPRITAYTPITRDGRSKQLGGTDGNRLYFTLNSPMEIEQVGVNGGETAPVPLAIPDPERLLMDVSPDGSTALVSTNEQGHIDNPLWIASMVGGSARHLADGGNAHFSPDGLSVIYWTYAGDIFLARLDGTANRKMAHVPTPAYSFSWSPDRKSIRFLSGGFIWEMASDGSGLHHLLPDGKARGSQYWGRWTPDGRFYLFTLETGPVSGIQIYALDERRRVFGASPHDPIRLTTGPIQWGLPIANRDGTKIFAEGVIPGGEMSRLDPRTGGLQPFLGGISAEYATFSGSGDSVAYVSFPDGKLWKADRNGGNRVLLSEFAGGSEYIFNPRWSPVSNQILFSTETADLAHSATYLISSDGGKPQKLVPEDKADTEDPNWSPDGKRILFFRGNTTSHEGDLRILDVDSGQVSVVSESSHLWSPRWSPDGRYIVAMYIDQRPALPLFDCKTQKWSTLPVGGDVEFPSFSHDSRYIYFLRFGHDQGVFRIPVTGGKEKRMYDMAKWHITGFMNFSMTLDPTDAPLLLRDTGRDDLYALTLEVK